MSDKNKDECVICYEKNQIEIRYFACLKYHNLCRRCFHKHSNSNLSDKCKCPLCKAELINECKQPNTLNTLEIHDLNKKNILPSNIFIHQNYRLNSSLIPIMIKYNDKTVSLYMENGMLVQHHDMFIGTDGFFYEYNQKHNCYILAVSKNRFQFWDTPRVFINLN